MSSETNLNKLIATMRPELRGGTYVFVTVSPGGGDPLGVTTRAVRSCTTQKNIIGTCGSADQAAAMNFSLAVRSGRKVRATFME